MKTKSNKGLVIALILACLLIALVPLFALKGAEFGGSDDAGGCLACNVARSGKRAGHKLVEHMPVKPGDIDIDRYGPGLGHACHGHEAGHEEVDVGQSVDGDAAHGAGEGREIEQGGDKPGGELFRHAPAQDEHFPEKDRPGARERMYFRHGFTP